MQGYSELAWRQWCGFRGVAGAVLVTWLLGSAGAMAQEQVFVELGAEWRYFKGTVAPPADWATEGFEDGGPEWLAGPTGIGYGDGDDATVLADMQMTVDQPGYVAFFARHELTIASVATIASLTLQIDYDDGFVAYLNGTEVARRGLGADGTPVAFDQSATGHEAGTPEYIPVSAASLHDGVNTLAIEIHNAGIGSTDASLLPRLLANAIIPPSGVACARPVTPGPVTVGWTNNNAYDSCRIERNGQTLATVAGTDVAYTDAAPLTVDNVYRVVGVVGGSDYPSLGTCMAACTQGTLTCSLSLGGDGVTQGNLSWSGVPDVTSVQIVREGAVLATLTAGETSYTDPNVQNLEIEEDTDYVVTLTAAAGTTCTMACQLDLCPTLTASVQGDTVVLGIGNLVKAWDHLEISRNGVIIDPAVPPATTSWTDPDVVLLPGSSYDYLLHPVERPGEEFPLPRTQCDVLFVLGYVPEIGSYNPPEGGWDYLIDFTAGQRQYNPVAGEAGNLDGRWIRALDRDLWNGQGPADPAGPAPEGPAPGGADLLTRTALGQCGTDASVLRILDPGDTAAPDPNQLGTAFPLPYNGGLNSRFVLGLDLGIIDRNVLKAGVTLMTRLRLSPDAPAYLNPQPSSGDGSGIANGVGHVGVYFRQDGTLPEEGVTGGAAVALNSGANGGDLVFSSAGQDVDSVGALNFVTVWMTVVGGATVDTYDVNFYLNGATNTSSEIGGVGLTLDAGVADFGPTVSNYLIIGSNDTGGDAMLEIDFVAYKVGVFVPVVDPCQGEPPNAPSSLSATPGDSQVTLAWSAPAGGVPPTAYGVYRDGAKIASVPAAQTSYMDTGRTNGTQYCYRVRSNAGLLESGDSNEACATPSGGGTTFHRGDADDNNSLQLTDAIRVLGYLFTGGPAPPCFDAADADDNGQLQLTDAIRILGYLFVGGVPPSPPGPPDQPCGEDTTADALDCASYQNC